MKLGLGLSMTSQATIGVAVRNNITAVAAAYDAGDAEITITGTTNFDVVRFGARISVGEGSTDYEWFDGAGAPAGAQSLTVSIAAIEALFGALPASAVINVDPGYSLTDPATVKVYASTSGSYPTPVVYSAVFDDTSPTVGEELNLGWDMIVGPIGQVVSYRIQSSDGPATVSTTAAYTPDAEDEGFTLTGRVTSTLGGLAAYDDTSSTDAVASSGPPTAGLFAWFQQNVGLLNGSDVFPSNGEAVKTWQDQSGNGRHITQGSAGKRPTYNTGGGITFDNAADRSLEITGLTLAQPFTVYIKMRPDTWGGNNRIIEFNGTGPVLIWFSGSEPEVKAFAAGGNIGPVNLATGVAGVVSVVFNNPAGATASSIQLDDGSPSTGDPGNGGLNAISLGQGVGSGGAGADMTAYEVLIYSGAHDGAARTAVLAHLGV